MKLTVVVEEFRPKRNFLFEFTVDSHGDSLSSWTPLIDNQIKELVATGWLKVSDDTTEIRWEYKDIGQGHYIEVCDALRAGFIL